MRARASMTMEASFVILLLVFVIGPPVRDSPTPPPITLSDDWTGDAASPYIVTTTPINAARDLPVTTRITVDFSEPMNTTSVNWTISGRMNATGAWSGLNTTLDLTTTKPFRDCTGYSVNVTGRDADDNLSLIPGPVPNPWWFRTACINPFIVSTDPVGGAVGVPLDALINVTFTEPMNGTSVAWDFSVGVNLTAAWNRSREVLSLTPEVPLPQCTVLTLAISAGTDDQRLPLVPGPVPNPWSWFSYCPNPVITAARPPRGAMGVPLNTSIVVAFSRPMNTTTLNWSIRPVIDLTAAWDPGDTLLTLRHAANFSDMTGYAIAITRGNDTGGLPLVPGPVPNPWFFVTLGINPVIVSTDPADGATDVPLDARIVVTFSKRMNNVSQSVVLTPAAPVTASWGTNPLNQSVLTLTPTRAFAPCTVFTVRIAARDENGLPLVPGPVPNPWSFRTVCGPFAPAGLMLAESPPASVLLTWEVVRYASMYRVYTTTNRSAAFPSEWTVLGTTFTNRFVATLHLLDRTTHYYLVRAAFGGGEGSNSTMGVKAAHLFRFSAASTNIHWFSLPYNTTYRRASDIALDPGPTRIDLVGKWDPANQTSVVYYHARGGWRGTDFAIGPGDGLYVGVLQEISWSLLGTDLAVPLRFTLNAPPKGNVNWVGLPYTGVYARASDIANELGPSRVVEIGVWNGTSQSVERWYWDGSRWAGNDFEIDPGAGVYLVIASDFTWTPSLLTPVVP